MTQQQHHRRSSATVGQSEEFQPQPGPSKSTLDVNQPSSNFASALSVLSPKPLPPIYTRRTTREKQHSEILTSTPMKTVFEEKKKKRLEKDSKTENKGKCYKEKCIKEKQKQKSTNGVKQKKNIIKSEKIKKVKKNIFNSYQENSSNEELDENEICNVESEYPEEENMCAVCLDAGKGRELWDRCRSCGNWSHAECSGSDSPDDYICEFCLDP